MIIVVVERSTMEMVIEDGEEKDEDQAEGNGDEDGIVDWPRGS